MSLPSLREADGPNSPYPTCAADMIDLSVSSPSHPSGLATRCGAFDITVGWKADDVACIAAGSATAGVADGLVDGVAVCTVDPARGHTVVEANDGKVERAVDGIVDGAVEGSKIGAVDGASNGA